MILSGSPRWRGDGRFQIIRELGEGGMGIVFEALDHANQTRVALKTLKTPDPATSYQLKWEFRSLSQLFHENLVQLYELISTAEDWFFTMELLDPGRDVITHLRPQPAAHDPQPKAGEHQTAIPPMGRRPCGVDLVATRSLFHQLCEGVRFLHNAHKLHRDIKPSNALVTPQGRVVLLDFGLVSEMSRGRRQVFRPRKPNDTAVGSLIGTIGYMAPEQAAGLTAGPASDCYAIGVMLFEALTGRLPFLGTGSSVLYSKQHYDALAPSQFVSGVPADLDTLCRSLLRRDPNLRPTILEASAMVASAASPVIVQVGPSDSVFVGRSAELALLQGCLERTRSGQKVIGLVEGCSGSGKTTLVEHFLRQVADADTLIFAGRCYENESVPFNAVDALVDSITRHLSALPKDAFPDLPTGAIDLARMFPVLLQLPGLKQQLGSGRCHPDPQISRSRAFAALTSILEMLISVHVVVLALDDLQWSDAESCALIRHLIDHLDASRILMLFVRRTGARRQGPVQQLMESLNQRSMRWEQRQLELGSLSRNESYALAHSLLLNRGQDAEALAAKFSQESGGSALLVGELVRHALTCGVADSATSLSIDGVIGSRILALDGRDRSALELICVAGAPIRIINVRDALISATDFLRTLHHLRAIRLISVDGFQPEDLVEPYHDQVRQAVLDRLGAKELALKHAQLAVSLESNQPQEPDTLAEHFRRGGMRESALRYALEAANKALSQFAFEHAERMLLQSLEDADTTSQRTEITLRLIHFYSDLARFPEAYAVARQALSTTSHGLPRSFCQPRFLLDWARVEFQLSSRSMEDLLNLPLAGDLRVVTSIKIMNAVAKAAYQIEPRLCAWVAVRIVGLCLQHGNTPECAIGYLVFGCIFKGGQLQLYDEGYQYGVLCLQLAARYGLAAQQAEVAFVVGYFGTTWKRPYQQAEALWTRAFQAGLSSGDRFHTGCAAAATIMSLFFRGEPFTAILERCTSYQGHLSELRLHEPLTVVQTIRQAIRCLQGRTASLESLSGDGFDEEHVVATLPRFGSRHFAQVYFIIKMQILYLSGNLNRALAVAAASKAYVKGTEGMIQQSEHAFYTSLIFCRALRQNPATSSCKRKDVSRVHQRYRHWAELSPQNYRARELLIGAESARCDGQELQALECFERSRQVARSYGQSYLMALGAMLQADCLSELGRHHQAASMRKESARGMCTWGGLAIAEALDRRALVGAHTPPAAARSAKRLQAPPESATTALPK